MPDIDVVDATWIGVPPAKLADPLADPANWRHWWPDLELTVDELRGVKGVRWFVSAAPHAAPHAAAGAASRAAGLRGSMEVWLQPIDDGTVLHYFLRLDPTSRVLSSRDREQLIDHYRVQTKSAFWSLSDQVDPGRLGRVAGLPAR